MGEEETTVVQLTDIATQIEGVSKEPAQQPQPPQTKEPAQQPEPAQTKEPAQQPQPAQTKEPAQKPKAERARADATPDAESVDQALMDAMLQDDYDSKQLRRGQIVEGSIVQVQPDEVLVDVGSKSEGVMLLA